MMKSKFETEITRWCICLCLCVSASGCGRPRSKPEALKNLVRVCGTVLYEGKPTPGAVVSLHPARPTQGLQSALISGTVGADGRFILHTAVTRFIGAGAPPGEYHASISWLNEDANGDSSMPLLPQKYADPNASGLRIEVRPGVSELAPIQLIP